MSGPLLGIGRITVPYTVSGRTHSLRMYVNNPTLAGSTWEIDVRPSVGGTIDWADAAESLANAMSNMLATGVTPGTALLEEYSSTGWLPRDTSAVTFPNLTGSSALASQFTLSLRDSNFTRPKIVLMEVNNPGPLKFTAPDAGGANVDAFVAEFLNTGVTTNRPWFVMANMHGHFLQEEPFISGVITYNHKMRKVRGFA